MHAPFHPFVAPMLLAVLAGCGGGSDSTSSAGLGATATSPTPTNNASDSPSGATAVFSTSLAAGYKQAKWAANVSISYPTECTMTVVTNGQPNHAIDAYYLQPPIGTFTTVVATAPVSGMALVVRPYTPISQSTPVTFNTCPVKAAATTATTGGNIGIMISGPALFNATEGENGRAAALSDNVSYTFKDIAGKSQTATFIDSCNGHPSPRLAGDTYHYHGLSTCVTAQVDVAGGASHLIGVAADGFPIYGDKDINGNTVTVAQLDACNGITSATPEFPNGVYHYVLPSGVTGFQSSLRCYSGTATKTQVASLQSPGVCASPVARAVPPRVWAATAKAGSSNFTGI